MLILVGLLVRIKEGKNERRLAFFIVHYKWLSGGTWEFFCVCAWAGGAGGGVLIGHGCVGVCVQIKVGVRVAIV